MRKQARRLWLGDWQRGDDDRAAKQPVDAGPDEADKVLLLPDDGGVDERRATRRTNLQRALATALAIAVLAGIVLALLPGGNDNGTVAVRRQTPPAQTPQAQPQVPQPQVPQGAAPPGFGGPDLTGPQATKAAEAAVSKFPGEVERVTRGPSGGGYIVHVIQPDGNEVHVAVSDGLKVLGSDAGRAPGGSGAGPTNPS